ncbi:bacillithiol biosynthesis cysteine-adding enzyme BshC [Candidatus Sumerlaeota bacterium]|nr:bacillithiol biosynthesis cysteine-adding enzyme BshC [Candidatus Sumerlaeota bacterium]
METLLNEILDFAQQRERCAPEPLTAEESAELLEAMREWGADEAALESGKALGQDGTLVVATGQQAGLLLGPLYTLYKALGAVKFARAAERRLGRRVVPVFWIASEDSDFEEAASVHYLDAAGVDRSWRYDPPGRIEGASVFSVGIDVSLEEWLSGLREDLPSTEWSHDVFNTLLEAAWNSRDMEEYFARLMARLTRGTGLALVAPRMKFIRRRGAAVLRRELERPGETAQLVIEAGTEAAQLHREPGDVNCFLYDDQWRRLKLRAMDDGRIGDSSGGMYSREELLEKLERDPQRFSFNVVSRPVAQDAIFPTLAYAGGPGECAYLEQLKRVYEWHGIPQPVIAPRPEAVLISKRTGRALEKLGLNAMEFLGFDEAVLRKRVAQLNGGKALDIVEAAQWEVEKSVDALDYALANADPAVRKSVQRLREMHATAFDKLRGRVEREQLQRDTESSRLLTICENALLPGGKPQERVLGAWFPFLHESGWLLTQRLLEKLDPGGECAYIEL